MARGAVTTGTARRAVLPDLLVFASGANQVGDIVGFSAVGHHIGVAAPNVSKNAERALLSTPTHIHVFVDSGAFSEVAFGPNGPRVVKPIIPAEWDKRLALYLRLARALGPRLHVVAPDMVGNQRVTLERLARYVAVLRAIAATGAEILVPLQRGALPIVAFEREVAAILAGIPFVPAIPSKKDATPLAELVAYLKERQPARVHLLGLGERSPRLRETLDAFQRLAPGTAVSLDANRISAVVGRTEATPRGLTAAQDYVRQRDLAHDYQHGDYTDLIGDPAAWLTASQLARVAQAAGLDAAWTRRFVADPVEARADLDDEDGYAVMRLDDAIEAAYAAYAVNRTATARRAEGLALTFGAELREVTPYTLTATLYIAAIERMRRPGSRFDILVGALDDAGFRGRVERACTRALA